MLATTIGLTLLITLAWMVACSDSEEDDVNPPGVTDDDDDDNSSNCPIPTEGMEELTFYAQCYDPTDNGNVLTVTAVQGTALVMEENDRYDIVGEFEFTTIGTGKIEPTITCPGGSNYQKCSWVFQEKTGTFNVRVQVSDCDYIDKPNEIGLNVWDSENAVNIPMCQIYLGQDEPPVDDDTGDDDTGDDDTGDDDTGDDDTGDDDTGDDDTGDDDTGDDDTGDDDTSS